MRRIVVILLVLAGVVPLSAQTKVQTKTPSNAQTKTPATVPTKTLTNAPTKTPTTVPTQAQGGATRRTRISHPDRVKTKENCFIVVSKRDLQLSVYEVQGRDTVLIARYDCCVGKNPGNKERKGDMRTPHCTMERPFTISQICNSSAWTHDFHDGRGSIKAYGDYFLRLVTPPHTGIGIHGSTNNRESVPGRASEGCIRLLDEDIVDLRKNYAFVGMKVVVLSENQQSRWR